MNKEKVIYLRTGSTIEANCKGKVNSSDYLKLRLIALGDIFLRTKDYTNPFGSLKKIFGRHDIIFGNLETTLSCRGVPIQKRTPIRTDPDKIVYLRNTYFDIVNLANNHIMDYGEVGLFDTISILKQKDIKFVGAGADIKAALKPVIFERNKLTVGFIGFTSAGLIAKEENGGCAPLNKELIIKYLAELRKKVDIVVVSLHWGIEYVFYPSPEQQKLARTLIDNGADLIIGHHPHVVQGIEKYRDKLIIYSLGNCNFGVEQDKNYKGADIGIIVSVEFSKDKIPKYELIPIKINSNYQPVLLGGSEKSKVLDFIDKISVQLQNNNIKPTYWYRDVAEIYLTSQIESYLIRIRKYGLKHVFMFLKWFMSPFVLKMECGYIINKLSRRRKD
jgi:poly-gamma-glutamate synthesis protein (capsule biosynthesis protein)